MTVQIVPEDPCAWISQAQAEQELGEPLLHPPRRVWSVDNNQSAAQGEACRFELTDDSDGPRGLSIHVIADESGVMQSSFAEMGRVDSSLAAQPTRTGSGARPRWDYVHTMPGGLTALRRGRVAVQITASASLVEKGVQLAGAMLEALPDRPFTMAAGDPGVPAEGADPCQLINDQETQALVGSLVVLPYRSRKETALAFGAGASCAYFMGGHAALVLTPHRKGGRAFFSMLGRADAKLDDLLPRGESPVSIAGEWDQVSIGPDGSLQVLKGDARLSVQFLTSSLDLNGAAKIAATALARLAPGVHEPVP